ncbi:MBL fold metallo-hydrolase [Methanocella sp. CWC-04]|uniref:MBL fold metallo-hydrolase n=1 Tax=Methanooceanicella nereidis TaxID=2052831 RepID=A0AAP2W8H5_9EURY|nr:MBL fold metallo-hydrolase [Methanocella sp. CWC-04]MCD1296051.1 MBL fold metallo-hydrolase [Methanocella sp. CWC-04]
MRITNVNGVFYDSNAYLIDAKRKILVDAGIDGKRVLKSLPQDLQLIVLTHCHYDHISAVPDIVAATGAKVAMHKDDIPLIRSKKLSASAMFGVGSPELKIDIPLNNDDTIDLGDCSLKVIHTPGHSPGSICLYDESTKELFTGDTVFEGGSFGRTDIGGNPEHLINSLENLTKLDVSAFYPGHGNIVTENANGWIKASYVNAKRMIF